MAPTESFPAVRSFLERFDRFAIFTHLTPDGDALGSAYSLCELLRQMGRQAEVLLLEPPPDNYDFDAFRTLFRLLKEADMREYDACIAVDCAAMKRLAGAAEAFSSLPNMSIDHHVSNDNFAQTNCVREAPAASQIIYDIYGACGMQPDHVAQMAIYMGIIADTGNLTYPSTRPRTFAICAQLAQDGLDTSEVAERVSNRRTLAGTKLIGIFIRHMTLHADDRIGVSYLTHSDIVNSKATAADCEGLVNYARDISTVQVAAFLRELARDKYKLSLRSKGSVDVAAVAQQYGGGGHPRAAGCVVEGRRSDLIARIVRELEESLT